MLWISLIILFLFFFGSLMFFFWYILKRNYSKATERLQSLSKDIVAKEEEADRVLQDAQKEAKTLLTKERQSAQETKDQMIKEAQEQRDHILKEANNKASEISEKAQRNADFMQKEFDNKVDERAKSMIGSLISDAIPKEFLEDIHQKWIDESQKKAFDLKSLKLPEKEKNVKIVSAFPLTEKQQEQLKERLKKKIGAGISLKTEIDPTLIVGFVISVGSVVVDASLRYRIQKEMQG